jgi:hypothetical protein
VESPRPPANAARASNPRFAVPALQVAPRSDSTASQRPAPSPRRVPAQDTPRPRQGHAADEPVIDARARVPICSGHPHRPRATATRFRAMHDPWRDPSAPRRTPPATGPRPSRSAQPHAEWPRPAPQPQPPAPSSLPDHESPARHRAGRGSRARSCARPKRPGHPRPSRDVGQGAPRGRQDPRARHGYRRSARRAGGPDPPGADRARRAGLCLRHPRHRGRGLRLHAPARPAPRQRRRVRVVQPGPPVRPPHRRPRHRGSPRSARGREVLGPDPRRQCQRRRHRHRSTRSS